MTKTTSGGAISTSRSAKDAPAHTQLKVRISNSSTLDPASSTSSLSQRDKLIQESLKKLQQVEERHYKNKLIGRIQQHVHHPSRTMDTAAVMEEEESRLKMIMATAEVDDEAIRNKYDDADEVGDDDNSKEGGRRWSDIDDVTNLDSSDSDFDKEGGLSEEDESDDHDDEDEEAALQAELAKIRAEREKAKARVEAAAAAEEQAKKEEAALVGNPLLHTNTSTISGKMKRRWNDDVVFRNQAKGEPVEQKRFINDTVRNDFHKRFLKTHFR